jgi:hypothetical protein
VVTTFVNGKKDNIGGNRDEIAIKDFTIGEGEYPIVTMEFSHYGELKKRFMRPGDLWHAIHYYQQYYTTPVRKDELDRKIEELQETRRMLYECPSM